MSVDEFVKKHNPLEVHIAYNEFKGNYDTMEDYFELDVDDDDIVDKEECLKNNSVFRFQVYPNTPIGFYSVYASTLEKAIQDLDEYLSEKEIKKNV